MIKKQKKKKNSKLQPIYNQVVLSSVHIQTYARAYNCMNDAHLLNNLTSQPASQTADQYFNFQVF